MGLLADIIAGFGEAVSDIRHKLVEEGWFGRQVTDREAPATLDEVTSGRTIHDASWEPPRQSFEEAWSPSSKDPTPDAPSPGREGPDLDR